MREMTEVIVVQAVSGFPFDERFKLFAVQAVERAVVKTPCERIEKPCRILSQIIRRKFVPRRSKVAAGEQAGPFAHTLHHLVSCGIASLRAGEAGSVASGQ